MEPVSQPSRSTSGVMLKSRLPELQVIDGEPCWSNHLQQGNICHKWSSKSDKSEQFKCKARATRTCSQDWTLGMCTCVELT